MRTTIELPDDLFRQVKAHAALSGVTLKELITRWVVRGLRDADAKVPAAARHRGPPPEIIPPRGRNMPALSNAEIHEILDAEDAGV